jgi:acetyltransferase
MEQEILDTARKYGIRVVGPNCVGAANAETGMMNAFGFFAREEKESDLSFVSQSGGIGNTFMRVVNDSHIFWHKFISIGNKLDLDETDFTEYFLNDPKTGKILYYLESFKRGRKFFDLLRASEKPAVIMKSNRSPASAKIAQSHTTAISTGDDIVDAALNQAAVIRVAHEDELKMALKAVMLPPLKGNRVAVLSRSGGHAVMTADACAEFGLSMIEFPPSFIEKLKGIYNTRVIAHQNPLDLGEIFDYTIFIKIVEEAIQLDEVDGIIFNHMYQPSYEAESSRTFLNAVADMVRKYNKPVSVSLTSTAEEILDIEKNHPFPIFSTPHQAVEGMHISLQYHNRKTARNNRGPAAEYAVDLKAVETVKNRCAAENRIPLTDEALSICAAAGIIPVKSAVIKKPEDIASAEISFPACVKLLSKDASHKSDIGGVRLNINSKAEALSAVNEMTSAVNKSDSRLSIDGFIVQKMAKPGQEFFVGGSRDASFGPIVVAGFGGIFIEIIKDRAIRLAPVTTREAHEMLQSLKAFPVLRGTRGRSALDIDALAEVICRVAWLMHTADYISEIDLNPVIVHEKGQGVSIVDSRVFF